CGGWGPGEGCVDRWGLGRFAGGMGGAPAGLATLAPRKGRIAGGCDADLVIWDPDAEWIVEPERLQQRHKLTPYAGRTLRGAVHQTYVRGERVWSDGILSRPLSGELL